MTDTLSISADARQWSKQQLGLEDQAGTPQILAEITDSNYVVNEDQTDAMQLLANPQTADLYPWMIERATRCGREAQLTTEVAEFANSFFQIPSGDQRKNQWRRLVVECEHHPELKQWLRSLEPGLLSECDLNTDGDLRQLVDM